MPRPAALSNSQSENCELVLMRHRPPRERAEILKVLDGATNRGAAVECWAAINFRNIAIGDELKELTGWGKAAAIEWADELKAPGSTFPLNTDDPTPTPDDPPPEEPPWP